jgi:hypothetical protein
MATENGHLTHKIKSLGLVQGELLHVDVQTARLESVEATVLGPGRLGLQVTQVAKAMQTKAAIKTGARDMRVRELAHHGQQVVELHQQGLAQRHRHGLLSRRQGGLQLVRRVAVTLETVAPAPFVDRLLCHPEARGQHRATLVTLLDRCPQLGRRRCLAVKMDQHVRAPSRMSHSTDLAMNRADRRGEM